jgi:hypothetical protein
MDRQTDFVGKFNIKIGSNVLKQACLFPRMDILLLNKQIILFLKVV